MYFRLNETDYNSNVSSSGSSSGRSSYVIIGYNNNENTGVCILNLQIVYFSSS